MSNFRKLLGLYLLQLNQRLQFRQPTCTIVHMLLVADTNIFLAVVLGQPERGWLIESTAAHNLVAPQVLPFELGNALSALARRGAISSSEALAAWDAVNEIPVELRPIDIRSAMQIAVRFQTYAYDAYFLECALSMRAPILTLDKEMRRVAKASHIQVVEQQK